MVRNLGSAGYLFTLDAEAIQDELVPPYQEAGLRQRVYVWKAAFQFKNVGADVAAEVMMVAFARLFVDGGLARKFNRHQPPFVHQCLHVSVDSRDPETIDVVLRVIKHLLWGKGPSSSFKCLTNCRSLPGGSLRRLSHTCLP